MHRVCFSGGYTLVILPDLRIRDTSRNGIPVKKMSSSNSAVDQSEGLATQITRGFGYLMRGYGLIRQPGLRRFVAVPLAINTIIFTALIWWMASAVGSLIAWVSGFGGGGALADFAIFQGALWLIKALLWLLVGVGSMVGVFYTFSLVANLIAAPFNSLLAEKVEKHLTGELEIGNEGWGHVIKSIPHVMLSELFKILYMLMWMIPLVLLWLFAFFIPLLNIVVTIAWLWFGAWLVSLEYVDYPAGNHGLTFPKVRKLMKQNRPSALGFGGAVTIMTSIPLVNLIAMPCAVAGATALWHDKLRDHPLGAPKTNKDEV